MDFERLFRETGDERAASALKVLLERFLSPAFGALPKSEIELLILGTLEEIGAISAEHFQHFIACKFLN